MINQKMIDLLINWYAWLEYDFKNNPESEDYYTYSNFRHWMIEEFLEWHNIDLYNFYELLDMAFIATWFDCDKNLDKQTLLDIKLGKNYEIKKTYKGIGLHLVE